MVYLDVVRRNGLGPFCVHGNTSVFTSNGGNIFLRGTSRVQLQKLADVVLGGLDNLHLQDGNVLKRIDWRADTLDLLSNAIGNELADNLAERASTDLSGENLEDALANGADLSALRIGGLSKLSFSALSESNDEGAESVTIRGLDVSKGLDQSLPLANKGASLVGSKVHTMDVGQAVATLNLIDTKAETAEGSILSLIVDISERQVQNTTTESLVSVLETLGTVDEGLSDGALREHHRCLDVIPLLASIGIDDLLLQTLFAL